jgi:hypothetical protein
MAILTSYVDSYNVSTIKESKNSLLVINMATSQIQLDFVLSFSSGIQLQKRGGSILGSQSLILGSQSLILGSQRPNLITFISPLAFDPLTKSTLLVLCAWLLHSNFLMPRR